MTTTPQKVTRRSPRRAAAADLVTLTIDDREVSVPKGTLIIGPPRRSASRSPVLRPPGPGPGRCVPPVPRRGLDAGPARTRRRPRRAAPDAGPSGPDEAAGVVLTVAPGMVVKTQYTSEGADKAQQGVMELLLINHPLDCPVCDKGGECPLQNQAMSNGRSTSRFEDVKRTYPKPINISSQVLLDRERCVLCAR